MTTPELPALRPFDTFEEVEARERILLARVAAA